MLLLSVADEKWWKQKKKKDMPHHPSAQLACWSIEDLLDRVSLY
jgi:hypothetical protein